MVINKGVQVLHTDLPKYGFLAFVVAIMFSMWVIALYNGVNGTVFALAFGIIEAVVVYVIGTERGYKKGYNAVNEKGSVKEEWTE